MREEYIAEVTIKRKNGDHLTKEDSFTMNAEEACSYMFFKYGAKGNVTSKLLAKLAFEWAQANHEMDLLMEEKRRKRMGKK
jgi:hypothetical protein